MPEPSLVFLEREQVLVCSSSYSADAEGFWVVLRGPLY